MSIKNASVLLNKTTLLGGIILDISPESALLLIGSNGSGKTSLLRLIAGQIAPTSGTREYNLGGHKQNSAVQARRSLSIVGPDEEAFYLSREWEQSVRDVLLSGYFGERLNLWEATPEAINRLSDVAELVGAVSLLDKDFRTLSHGQRRRVILGRALMPNPEILLLDEFSDGLSASARSELGSVIKEVHAQGVALVAATHRPEELPDLEWQKLYMEGGSVLKEAPKITPTLSLPVIPASNKVRQTLVKITNAHVYRNGNHCIGAINWEWKSGEHWLITGENGSGKSTLARLISGELHPALGGSIKRPYLNPDLASSRRQTIGIVGAELGIRQRRHWTGLEIIGSAFAGTEGFTEELSREQYTEATNLAKTLELSDLLGRSAENLSQGQLRRLLLARAVVHKPKLLILDEGLDFLDAKSRQLFTGLLPDLLKNGTHLMVIAHRNTDSLPWLNRHMHLASLP